MSTKYPKLHDKEWLESKISTTPLRLIAQEIGCSHSAVVWASKSQGIRVPKRKRHIFNYDVSQWWKNKLKEKYPNGRFGKLASNWRGGRRLANKKQGYIYIYSPDHPNRTQDGYVMEHILVAEKKIGRYLKPGEIVHHINHVKNDNRPENLQVMTRSAHVQLHFDEGRELAELKGKLKKYEDKFGVL